MGPLLAERTRILITHHVRLCINGASHITVLENGDIQASGSPRDLAESNMLQEILHHEDEVVEHHASTASKRKTVGDPTVLPVLDPLQAVIEPDTQPKKLVEREKRAKGYVKAKLYIKYGKALGGWLFWTFFAIVFLSTRGLTIGSSFWIKKWTEDIHKTEHETTGSKGDGHDVDYYIRVYALLTLAQLFFNILRFAVVYYGSLRAGRLLFAEMLQHVFSAPLRFFGTFEDIMQQMYKRF
jgi:ABC-type multidrug transport system fused ATPase/permease subunit